MAGNLSLIRIFVADSVVIRSEKEEIREFLVLVMSIALAKCKSNFLSVYPPN